MSSSAIACQNLSGIAVSLAGSSGELELVGHACEFGVSDVGHLVDRAGEFGVADVGLDTASVIVVGLIGCGGECGIIGFGRDELFDVYDER